jgi:uncharacterized BrkB/YihY/UPF0761 family membrane protein
MNLRTPKNIAKIGGIFITISGFVNAVLGAQIGSMFYDVYPGGRMGHVGIVAGIAAVGIGLVILFLIVPVYERKSRGSIMLAGILTILLGHIGAIAGAIYIGTVGVVLCYTAGIWAIVAGSRLSRL